MINPTEVLGPKVNSFAQPDGNTQQHYSVRYNRPSLLISFLFFFNVSVMPLKAYLSEFFPFSNYALTPVTTVQRSSFSDHASYEAAVIHQLQQTYNISTLKPHGIFEDSIRGVTIARQVVQVKPLPVPQTKREFLYQIRGSTFFPTILLDKLERFGSGQLNASLIMQVIEIRLVSIPMLKFAVWVVPGDELTQGNLKQNVYTMYVCQWTIRKNKYWGYIKLLYRLISTFYIVYRMWKSYFAKVWWLKKQVEANGIRKGDSKGKLKHLNYTDFEIVVGDPTSMVIADPLVSTLFIIDLWISMDIVVQAAFRVMKFSTDSIVTFFFGLLYVSRMVWLCYGALRLTSFIAKRLKLCNSCKNLDITSISICTFFLTGGMMILQNNTSQAESKYTTNNTQIHPFTETGYLELFLGYMRFMISLCIVPVGYCVVGGIYTKLKKRYQSQKREHGKHSNSKKNTLLLHFCGLKISQEQISGGGAHDLYELDKKFQRILTIDQRDSDCFVYCRNGSSVECIRITPATCIYRAFRCGVSTGLAIDFLRFHEEKSSMDHAQSPKPAILSQISLTSRWVA